ncbi:MAG: DMT family transporter [Candidatus Woesearchaeota archaeon]
MDPTLFLVAAFGAMLAWGVGDFLIQRSVRTVGSVQALAFIGIVGSVGLLPFVVNDFQVLASWNGLIILIVLGVVTYAVAIMVFDALKDGKLAIIDVLLELELPVVIFLGFVFFKETLTGLQALIVAIIFVGMILIALERFSWKKHKWEKGVLLGVAAAVGIGVLDFLTAAGARAVSPLMAVWVPWVIFTIISFVVIFYKKEFGLFIKNAKAHRNLVFMTGFADTIAWLFYALALTGAGIGITTAITEAYPAIAVVLGVLLNKERIRKHQWLGVLLTIGGSIALAILIT